MDYPILSVPYRDTHEKSILLDGFKPSIKTVVHLKGLFESYRTRAFFLALEGKDKKATTMWAMADIIERAHFNAEYAREFGRQPDHSAVIPF